MDTWISPTLPSPVFHRIWARPAWSPGGPGFGVANRTGSVLLVTVTLASWRLRSAPEYRRNSYVLPILIHGASCEPYRLAPANRTSAPPSSDTYTGPGGSLPVVHMMVVRPTPTEGGTGFGSRTSEGISV